MITLHTRRAIRWLRALRRAGVEARTPLCTEDDTTTVFEWWSDGSRYLIAVFDGGGGEPDVCYSWREDGRAP